MHNTQKRILSSFALIGILSFSFFMGSEYFRILILIVGFLCVDEINCNIFKNKRKSTPYIISQIALLIPFISLSYFQARNEHILKTLTFYSLLFNCLFIATLFLKKFKIKIFKIIHNLQSLFIFFTIFPIIILSIILSSLQWKENITILLLITISMDSGAWLTGKLFGKRKLCPNISPNKTIEGFIGGVIISGILSSSLYYFYYSGVSLSIVLFFIILSIISHSGDLTQSLIKREYNIKDSSNLIPGHGGVYDRIDSLLFLTPFYYYGLLLKDNLF